MKNTTAADFLKVYKREHETTRRVLIGFPAERADFKPHDRSNDAKRLAFLFPMEERLMLLGIRNEPILGAGFPEPPATWQEVLDKFEELNRELVHELERLGDSTPDTKVTFFTGPKQTGEFALMDFLWFMLFDQIHHRGQMSVYVRMAGGRVPSIYGPSADEPWV